MAEVDARLTRVAMRSLVAREQDDVSKFEVYRGYLIGERFFASRAEVDSYIEQVVQSFRLPSNSW